MKKTLLALALTVGLLLPAAMFADTAAWEWSTTGIEGTNGDWTFGQVFTPTQNFQVDFLGYYNPTVACSTSTGQHLEWHDRSAGRILDDHLRFRLRQHPLPLQHD